MTTPKTPQQCAREIRERKGPIADRLAARSRITESGCIEFTGHLNAAGYGVISINSRLCLAHRAAWVSKHGAIPDGLWVLHRCDNPACMNVEHLFLGNAVVNAADMVAKGRHWDGSRRRSGENHYAAIMTEADVLAVRKMRAAGETRLVVHQSYPQFTPDSLDNAMYRKTWRHLP